MANPTPYERTYSFTDYQASNPSAPLPGLQVDNELENIEQSLGEAIDAIKDVRRSDGALKNGIVTVDSLDATVAAGVGAGALASAEAAANSADAAASSAVAAAASAGSAAGSAGTAATSAGQAMTFRNEASTEKTLAQTARTGAQTARDFANQWAVAASGVDVNDGVNPVGKSAYHWAQAALGAAAGALPDGSVTTPILADEAVTEAKLAPAVAARFGEVATGAVTDESVAADAEIASSKLSFQHQTIASPPIVTSMQELLSEGLTLRMCANGPVGDGTDVTVALQKMAAECANLGFTGKIGRGDFLVSDTIVFDEEGATSVDAKRGGLIGEGPNGTILRSAFSGAVLNLVGGASPGIALHSRFGDFMLYRQGLAKTGTGITIDNFAWSDFERIAIYGFDTGIAGSDFLTSTLRRCTIRNNKCGLTLGYTDFSRPNALSFMDLELGMNSEFGAILSSPTTLNWIGGAVEGNGIGNVGDRGFVGGVLLVDGGHEGAVGASFQSVYFEYNKGTADVRMDHTANDAVYSFEGCTFNRISSEHYVTANISLSAGGTSVVNVGINRCAFKGFNSYVESAARPYIGIPDGFDGRARVVTDDTTLFKSDTAYVDPAKFGTATRAGSVSNTGVASPLPRLWTSSKVATGTYTVTHNLGTLNYAVTATSNSTTDRVVQRIVKATNTFTVVTATPAGVLADDAFNFVLRRY